MAVVKHFICCNSFVFLLWKIFFPSKTDIVMDYMCTINKIKPARKTIFATWKQLICRKTKKGHGKCNRLLFFCARLDISDWWAWNNTEKVTIWSVIYNGPWKFCLEVKWWKYMCVTKANLYSVIRQLEVISFFNKTNYSPQHKILHYFFSFDLISYEFAVLFTKYSIIPSSNLCGSDKIYFSHINTATLLFIFPPSCHPKILLGHLIF